MILCACGCGTKISGIDKKGRSRRFVLGHNGRKHPHISIPDEVIIQCACGCGTKFQVKDENGRPRVFVHGHNKRTHLYIPDGTMKLCECGCGTEIPAKDNWGSPAHFVFGHYYIGRKRTEKTKEKLRQYTGEKHHNWQGGTSFEPYCPKFNEAFKEEIREMFNRECFLCSKSEADNGKKLSVHHVTYDKSCLCNDAVCKFIPLCQSCHGKTGVKRDYWEKIIIEKLSEAIKSR